MKCLECGKQCQSKCCVCEKNCCRACKHDIMVHGVKFSACPYCSVEGLRAKIRKTFSRPQRPFNPDLVS